jgi:hypothetical protein
MKGLFCAVFITTRFIFGGTFIFNERSLGQAHVIYQETDLYVTSSVLCRKFGCYVQVIYEIHMRIVDCFCCWRGWKANACSSIQLQVLVLNSVLLLLLSLENYVAHSRILLLYLASTLTLSVEELVKAETKVAQSLLTAAKRMSGDEEAQKRSEENEHARRWKVGLATAAGAAILGKL